MGAAGTHYNTNLVKSRPLCKNTQRCHNLNLSPNIFAPLGSGAAAMRHLITKVLISDLGGGYFEAALDKNLTSFIPNWNISACSGSLCVLQTHISLSPALRQIFTLQHGVSWNTRRSWEGLGYPCGVGRAPPGHLQGWGVLAGVA